MNNTEHDTCGNVIIHVGTNALHHNSIDRIVEELDESLTFLQARNPDCQVTFSCIFKRKDSSDLSEKGQAVNRRLKERLMIRGIDYIENENTFSNLARDGLHIN